MGLIVRILVTIYLSKLFLTTFQTKSHIYLPPNYLDADNSNFPQDRRNLFGTKSSEGRGGQTLVRQSESGIQKTGKLIEDGQPVESQSSGFRFF